MFRQRTFSRDGRRLIAVTLIGLGVLSLSQPVSRAAVHADVARATASIGRPACGSGSGSDVFSFVSGTGIKVISTVIAPVCASGRVVVSFHGRQPGCGAAGLCAYRGSDVLTPSPEGDLIITTFLRHGHRIVNLGLDLFDGDPDQPTDTASVQRTLPSGSTTACSDQTTATAGFLDAPVHRGRALIGLRHPEGLLGSRCAGPTDGDVAAALPERPILLSRLEHGDVPIDLTTNGTFTSQDFSGAVRSTLRLTVGHPTTQAAPSRPSPSGGPTEVLYTARPVAGAVRADVRTTRIEGLCGSLDSCGLHGAVTLAPHPGATGRFYLAAFTRGPRSHHDVLSALGLSTGGNTAGIDIGGGGEISPGGTITADLSQGGTRCHDQVAVAASVLSLHRHGRRLIAELSTRSDQTSDPLRTRCPGPELGEHPLATGSVPLSILHHRTFTLTLHGASFSDGPYRVTTHPTMRIALTRRSTRTAAQLRP